MTGAFRRFCAGHAGRVVRADAWRASGPSERSSRHAPSLPPANGNSPLGDSTGDFVWQTSQLSPGYPASPGGQLSFVTDELSILAQVPGGLGAGLFYWAPDWIPGVPWEPGANIGSPNVNLTLFNFEGAALPSVGIFQNPAAVCERYAPDSSPCTVG